MSTKTPKPALSRRIPDGDERERLVCDRCSLVVYENPKIVVGSVAHFGEQILLCRRAIEPADGYWTLPAGFMELGETTAEGAAREAHEEANAHIEIETLLAVYELKHISQVQFMYRSRLLSPEISAGVESREVGLFRWEEIPWDELAFPSVRWALNHFRETRGQVGFPPFSIPPDGRGERLLSRS